MAATAVMTRVYARKKIRSKNFFVRIKSMLNLDFYRLFHTPAFYIMLCIAAFVPAMVLSMTGQDTVGPNGEIIAAASAPYTNVWQVLAPLTPTYVVADMGEYANINMVYIFSGILSSIFIGHDYMSGFVKNVFTVHSKKFDYIISKIIVGVFCTLCMFVTYFAGMIFAGVLTGLSFEVSITGLLCCILGKVIMSVGFSGRFQHSVCHDKCVLPQNDGTEYHSLLLLRDRASDNGNGISARQQQLAQHLSLRLGVPCKSVRRDDRSACMPDMLGNVEHGVYAAFSIYS